MLVRRLCTLRRCGFCGGRRALAEQSLFLREEFALVRQVLALAAQQRLPHATIVSIGHRSTLAAFHRRRLDIVREGDHAVLSEAKLTPAE